MFSGKHERRGADLLPNSEEAVAERLDMLASTVSSTAAAMARTDGELAGLKRDLGNGLARIEELIAEMRSRARASDVRELDKKLTALTFEHSKTSESKRLDDVGAKVSVLAERVDTLASTIATTAASIAAREGEIATLRRQVGDGSPAPALDQALVRRVEDAASAAATSSLRVESYGDRIGELAQQLEALDEQLAALTRRVEQDEHDRVALAASVADASATRWLEVERMVAGLTDRLDAAEERGSATSAELARATSLWPSALRALEARIEELESASHVVAAAPPQPAADTQMLVALRTLEQRLQRADEAAREDREAVLERLEQLTGQLAPATHDRLPMAAEVVRFRPDH
jgi:chromosome segregation ATPase